MGSTKMGGIFAGKDAYICWIINLINLDPQLGIYNFPPRKQTIH